MMGFIAYGRLTFGTLGESENQEPGVFRGLRSAAAANREQIGDEREKNWASLFTPFTAITISTRVASKGKKTLLLPSPA